MKKICVKRCGENTGLKPAAYLGFNHLADIVLQADLHSCQFGSDYVVQLTSHWLQTLRDC